VERTPQTLVIDASTAAKWFLEEEDSDRALSLRDAHIDGRIELTAPDLIVYELSIPGMPYMREAYLSKPSQAYSTKFRTQSRPVRIL